MTGIAELMRNVGSKGRNDDLMLWELGSPRGLAERARAYAAGSRSRVEGARTVGPDEQRPRGSLDACLLRFQPFRPPVNPPGARVAVRYSRYCQVLD